MSDKNKSLLWLIASFSLFIFSNGIIIYTATNPVCQIGPAICGAKKWGAYIGFFLSVVALSQSVLISTRESRPKNTRNRNHINRWGLLIFGILIIITSIIMPIIGMTNKSLNPPGAAVSAGVAMVIVSIPIAIIGIIITCFGIYYANKIKKHPEKESHPILLALFIIGIITMLFFLLGH